MFQGLLQILLSLLLVILLTPVLGKYFAEVAMDAKTFLDPLLNPVERLLYRLCDVDPDENMDGRQYIQALLTSNTCFGILVFLLLTFQALLPLNPTDLGAMPWDTALHTTISFLVAADLQHYTPETTMTYFSQMAALGFLMFVAPATGFAVGVAFIRGLTGRPLGNFYVDLIRSITRITLPLAVVGSLMLIAAGVPETLSGVAIVPTLEDPSITQAIARGPVAHFQIIKMLGENGGAFFGAGSAHPFENPNGFTNLLQVLAMLAFPAGLIYTYGIYMGNSKQSWRVFWMVLILVTVLIGITAVGEYHGNPLVNSLLGSQQPNLEGKEVRFGWAQTALFGIATTATMTGASNAAFDSWMPPGQFSALLNLFLQVLFGSVGTGTAQLFVYLLAAIFVIGLMVGRTPEFLGRKIERAEVTLIGAILLLHPLLILIPSAIAIAFPEQLAGISNPGFHGLTQVVFEFASAAAGNGTNMAGLGTSHPAPTALWYTLTTTVTLWAGRYLPAIALLLIADRFSHKSAAPASSATLSTDTWLFMSVTAATIVILGALTFFPILVLGPIAEGFQLNA